MLISLAQLNGWLTPFLCAILSSSTCAFVLSKQASFLEASILEASILEASRSGDTLQECLLLYQLHTFQHFLNVVASCLRMKLCIHRS